jgi:hypothetical protein
MLSAGKTFPSSSSSLKSLRAEEAMEEVSECEMEDLLLLPLR